MALSYIHQNEPGLGTNSLMLVPAAKVSKGVFAQAVKKMPL
jgi:hypothetical protein